MRALYASTSLVAALAFTAAALAQTATSTPPAAAPAPRAPSTDTPTNSAPSTTPGAQPMPGAQPTPAAQPTPGAQPAPSAQPTPGAQPTPDVPTPPGSAAPAPSEPPPAAPPPTAAVETPGATTTSSGGSAAMLGVNVPRDKTDSVSEPPAKAPDPWQAGHALGVEAMFRGGSRIGSPSVAADTEEKAGLGFDLGAWFRLARAFSLGLSLRRSDLGNISATSGASSVNAGYSSTALLLGARVYPLRWSSAEIFLGLHAGLAWQEVEANGLRPSVNLEPPQVYECSDSAGPGFALGAEIGGALRLTRAFWLLGNVSGDGYGLTSEPVGNCVNGLGTITTVSVGIGLLYAFDLGREANVASAPPPSHF